MFEPSIYFTGTELRKGIKMETIYIFEGQEYNSDELITALAEHGILFLDFSEADNGIVNVKL